MLYTTRTRVFLFVSHSLSLSPRRKTRKCDVVLLLHGFMERRWRGAGIAFGFAPQSEVLLLGLLAASLVGSDYHPRWRKYSTLSRLAPRRI